MSGWPESFRQTPQRRRRRARCLAGSSLPGTGLLRGPVRAGELLSAALSRSKEQSVPRRGSVGKRRSRMGVSASMSDANRRNHGSLWWAPVASASAVVRDRLELRLNPSKTTFQIPLPRSSIVTLRFGVRACRLWSATVESRTGSRAPAGRSTTRWLRTPVTVASAWERAAHGVPPHRRPSSRRADRS